MAKIEVNKANTFTGHRDCVYALTGGKDPYHFFTSGSDGLVVSWSLHNPDQGTLVAKVQKTVYALHYLKENNQLLIGQNFEGLHLVDLNHMQETQKIKITDAAIFDLAIWKDLVFAATGDGKIVVCALPHLHILHTIEVSGKSVRAMAINPLTLELAAATSDHTIKIIDLQTMLVKKTLEGHSNSVFCVQYTPDFAYLLSGSRDAHLFIWDVRADYLKLQPVVAHMFTINHIAFHPDGTYFATCSKDKSIKVWDTQSFRLLKVIDKSRHAGHGTSVNKLLWVGDGVELVSCSDDKTISHWQLGFQEKATV
jgi:WD40 repeat protein